MRVDEKRVDEPSSRRNKTDKNTEVFRLVDKSKIFKTNACAMPGQCGSVHARSTASQVTVHVQSRAYCTELL